MRSENTSFYLESRRIMSAIFASFSNDLDSCTKKRMTKENNKIMWNSEMIEKLKEVREAENTCLWCGHCDDGNRGKINIYENLTDDEFIKRHGGSRKRYNRMGITGLLKDFTEKEKDEIALKCLDKIKDREGFNRKCYTIDGKEYLCVDEIDFNDI